jgi:hypothetical protein
MKSLNLDRTALPVCVAAILLAGCSQSNYTLPQSKIKRPGDKCSILLGALRTPKAIGITTS